MMKKSKLSIGLVTSFIGALALTACNSASKLSSSKKSIVDFIGYNSKDEKIEINIDDFYSKYGDSEEGTNLFYNAVLETLIRYEYEDLSEKYSTLKSYSTLLKEADDKVTAQKQTARENAKTNGTKVEEEWEKILKSFDVKNTKELKQYYLYQLEKDAINDWYYKDNVDTLLDQYLGISDTWTDIKEEEKIENVDPVYPYHILHILVKLSADANDYTRATITSSEAERLWNVVRNLIDKTYTFENVAYALSEDSSNKEYGDVGIMSTQTSFYNEFKLGIYAYDALLSGVNKQSDADINSKVYKAFGLDDQAEVVTSTTNKDGEAVENKEKVDDLIEENMFEDLRNAVTGYGATPAAQYTNIPTIPYDVFRRIGLAKDEEKIGTFDPESGAAAYPRNVLFNQFLNFRSPFIITDEDIAGMAGSDKERVVLESHDFKNGNTDRGEGSVFNNDLKIGDGVTNFVAGAVPSASGKKVLCDGEGNVIIGVRSTAGIHFMVMRKSVFENTNASVGKVGEGYSLQDYYTTKDYDPKDTTYPPETYVNMKDSDDSSYYRDRINTIKNKLKGSDSSDVYDAAYEYRIYELLLDELDGKITFFDDDGNGSKVAENIERKIDLLREMKHLSNEESINDAWTSYLAQLRHQNEMRAYKGFMKTTCAFKFSEGNEDDFKEDGECYVK